MNRQGLSGVIIWVFIVVAGGLLLTLFVLIANTLADSAENDIALSVFDRMGTLISSQEASTNTFIQTRAPAAQMRFTCEHFNQGDGNWGLSSNFIINNVQQPITRDMVAARDLEANEVILFAKELKLPYSIGNILFVTSIEDERLILVDELGTAGAIRDTLVGELPLPLQEPGVVGSQPLDEPGFYENVRTVFMYADATTSLTTPSFVPGQANTQIMAIRPAEAGVSIFERANIYYWNNGWSAPKEANSPEMLLAYMWMGDERRADCMHIKIAQRLAQHTALHTERATQLSLDYAADSNTYCADHFTTLGLNTMRDATTPVLDASAPRIDASGNEHPAPFNDLYNAIRSMQAQNQRLIIGDGCATFY